MNDIKLNPDGPDEHGSFTHPQDCMCHDCLPGSNPLPTPNAGEKCPHGLSDGCPPCHGAGFKRAGKTVLPTNLILKCDCIDWKLNWGITLDDQDIRELGYSKCPYCKKPFDQVSPSPAADVKERESLREIKQKLMANWILLSSPLADCVAKFVYDELTTKLAALQVERESFRKELEYISETLCGVKVEGDIKHDIVSAFVEGEIDKLDDQNDQLRAENQGLIKEVERLREAIDCLNKFYSENNHDWKRLPTIEKAALEALKPTPEGSK